VLQLGLQVKGLQAEKQSIEEIKDHWMDTDQRLQGRCEEEKSELMNTFLLLYKMEEKLAKQAQKQLQGKI
jgi:hypothetical protein